MWTISLPLRVAVSKNKEFALNLNQYRNAHFHVLNKAKSEFTDIALKLIQEAGIPTLAQVTLEYIVYPGTRQLCDVNNICTVVDKFFSDTLVEAKIISDDNYKFVPESRFRFGGIDRENPRVDVVIRDATAVLPKEREQSDMKISTVIILTQLDLSTAIREFLAARNVKIPEGDFSFTLDNGTSGYQVRFEKTDDQANPEPVKTKKQKMDPKAAMEKVNEYLVTTKTPSQETVVGAIPVPVPQAELANKEPSSVAVEVTPVVPVKDPGVPAEVKPVAAPATLFAAPVPAQEAEVVPPPPPKNSLFANFKRPSKEPK